MAIKDLLISLDSLTAPDAQLPYAVQVTEALGAHAIGVAHIPAGETEPREEVQRAMDRFASAGDRSGISRETRLAKCSAGKFAEQLSVQARHVDLTIIGQPSSEGANGKQHTALYEELLFHSGRPVLVVPWAGHPKPKPRTAIVAWDASSTAARALSDAMPILSLTEKVIVLVATDDRQSDLGTDPGTDIAHHLARHDLNVEVRRIPLDPETPTADLLLSQSADLGADLMVMGGYHHSRMREVLFGGVTRTVIKTMTVPVLMPH